jgi:lipopolysaccharide export system permease protein
MRIGLTLPERYLMRRTLVAIGILAAACFGLIVSIDFLEALRQVGNAERGGVGTAMRLTMLRGPQLLMILSPFIVLFGTLMAFTQLAKSLEVAVFRAAGFSVWRIVWAPVLLSLILGAVLVTLVDPMTTRMSLAADNLLEDVRGRADRTPRAFENGVWLRQTGDDGVLLIRASDLDLASDSFLDVFVWRKGLDGAFIERFDASLARLDGRQLILLDAERTVPGGAASRPVGNVTFPTTFAMRDLVMSGTRPESLNLWNLPGLMQRLGNAGIPLEPFAMRLNELLALPVRLAAMAVLALVFALPIHARGGGTAALIIGGIAAGFVAFILTQFSQAVAEASLVPVRIAAWTPPLVTLLVGLSAILFREDG